MHKQMENLIIEIAGGSKTALENLYADFRHAVYAFSLSILHSPSLAQDVSQEVFIKIWTNSHTYKVGGNPKAWIMGITKNAAIDCIRKQKNETPIYEIDLKDPSNFEDDINSSEILQKALQNLKDDEREIVVLKAISGMSAIEISRFLKTPLNTVYWKLNKAIKALKQMEVFHE